MSRDTPQDERLQNAVKVYMDDNWIAVANHVRGGVSSMECRDRYIRTSTGRKAITIISAAALECTCTVSDSCREHSIINCLANKLTYL